MTISILNILFIASQIADIHAASSTVLELKNFQLRPNGTALKTLANELGQILVSKANVIDIMNNLNRPEGNGDVGMGEACNPSAGEPLDRPVVAWSNCFDSADSNTEQWYPQGVTTVGDASANGYWKFVQYQPVLVSWYDHNDNAEGGNKGVRLSFHDINLGKYRHVLLVYPRRIGGRPSYDTLRVSQVPTESGYNSSLHAGGILWYGNHLFVADTALGFRMFDVRQIYDLGASSAGTTSQPTWFGYRNGSYHAYGYRYIMPQVGLWLRTAARGTTCSKTRDAAPNFSYVSLDRSGTDYLVAGEYCDSNNADLPADDLSTGRVAAWKIAGAFSDGELVTNSSYRWNAVVAHNLPISNVQGATRFNAIWYLSQSNGATKAGKLYITEKATQNTTALKWSQRETLSIGPEDLSHWPKGTASAPAIGDFWTVAEHPRKRMLYSVV